jgi:hypothetical protein
MKTSIGEANNPRSMQAILKNSLLYRELTAEHEEILKHKWIESEKVGHDIGLGFAQIDWYLKHRSQWRKERQARHTSTEFAVRG